MNSQGMSGNGGELPPNVPPIIDAPMAPLPPPRKKGRARLLLVIVSIMIFCGLSFAGFVAYRIYKAVQYGRAHPDGKHPGRTAFHQAENLILTDHGTNAFGNGPAATHLAELYSRGLHAMRQIFFTKSGKPSTLTQVEGQFLTYCQLNPDSCVFLVHVPELRTYTDDAKSNLAQLAWTAAQAVLRDSSNPPPKTVVVGVKGLLLYDSVMIGDFEPQPLPGNPGIKTRSSGYDGEQLIFPYFALQTNAPNAAADADTTTNLIPEEPAPTATTTAASTTNLFELDILSARYGAGKNFENVTPRFTELLRTHPDGFTVDPATLGADPLPGKKEHLNIRYKCGGSDHVLRIPTGKKVTRQALLDRAKK